jgi:hypothetical protein
MPSSCAMALADASSACPSRILTSTGCLSSAQVNAAHCPDAGQPRWSTGMPAWQHPLKARLHTSLLLHRSDYFPGYGEQQRRVNGPLGRRSAVVRAAVPASEATAEASTSGRVSSKTKRVLVIGGTGRVGGSTAAALARRSVRIDQEEQQLELVVAGRSRYVAPLGTGQQCTQARRVGAAGVLDHLEDPGGIESQWQGSGPALLRVHLSDSLVAAPPLVLPRPARPVCPRPGS